MVTQKLRHYIHYNIVKRKQLKLTDQEYLMGLSQIHFKHIDINRIKKYICSKIVLMLLIVLQIGKQNLKV